MDSWSDLIFSTTCLVSNFWISSVSFSFSPILFDSNNLFSISFSIIFDSNLEFWFDSLSSLLFLIGVIFSSIISILSSTTLALIGSSIFDDFAFSLINSFDFSILESASFLIFDEVKISLFEVTDSSMLFCFSSSLLSCFTSSFLVSNIDISWLMLFPLFNFLPFLYLRFIHWLI